MKNTLLILTLALGLSGCAGVVQGDTPELKLFELVARYTVVQEGVIGYKQICEDQHVPKGCAAHVRVLRDINSKGNDIIQATKSNNEQPDFVAASTVALRIVFNQLSAAFLTAKGD